MKWFHVLIVCCVVMTTNVVTASTGATYNSFVHQIGYCKMQSYDTVSRSTSGSVPMFMDGRVQFGVGLSSINTDDPQAPNLCGMCLNVTHIEGMPIFNQELTTWSYEVPQQEWFIAMVFDRCGDEICVRDFLDFDIYSDTQPVAMGNPHSLEWHPIPCPVRPGERIEYLICTSTTCNAQDQVREHLLQEPQYYWSIILRNLRVPVRQVIVNWKGSEYTLRRGYSEASWVWDYHLFVLQEGIYITLVDQENNTFHDSIFLEEKDALASYHGGYWKQASFAY